MSIHDRIGGRAALQRSAAAEPILTPALGDLGGYEVDTAAGTVYCIDLPLLPAAANPQRPGPALYLWQKIELIYGIGPITAAHLRAEGWGDLRDLVRHPRWGAAASQMVQAIERADLPALRAAGARDAELACYFSADDFALVDIETTGLAKALPLFLVGLAWWDKQRWHRRQIFARGFEEERACLMLAVEMLAQRPGLASYNGRTFDEPFVRARLAYHRLQPPGFLLHFDVYQETRRLEGLPDRRLSTVARHMLGRERGDDTPGSLAPELYYAYLEQQDPAVIQPVLEHNAQDLADLCQLFDLARYAPYSAGDTPWHLGATAPAAGGDSA